MLDIIEVGNQYYVRAQSSFVDHQTRVLMSGDIFGVFDRRGDFRRLGSTEQGLFYREMRHLSRLVLRLKEGALQLLSSSIKLDNAILAVDLTNAEMSVAGSKPWLAEPCIFIGRISYGETAATKGLKYATTLWSQSRLI
jgi:N-terminal domain of (some) glycogen debranching enzymes